MIFFSASTLLFGTVYWALMISSVPCSNMASGPSGNILEIFDRMKVCMFSFFNFITVFKYPLYLYFKEVKVHSDKLLFIKMFLKA